MTPALEYHKNLKGKIEVVARGAVKHKGDLALAYTPGVAEPCLEIAADKSKVYDYIRKGNMVAVVTDASAVLGNIGTEVRLPAITEEMKLAAARAIADLVGTSTPERIIPDPFDGKIVPAVVADVQSCSE
jgi:malate dehydrogenase (oxaloacetate-decarboxylating)